MSRVTCFILRGHTGTSVSHSQHRNSSGEVLEKMQVNGPEGWKLARKKSLAVGEACMAIYWPTPGFKRRTFELWVLLNRGDFTFWVHNAQLQGKELGERFPKKMQVNEPDGWKSARKKSLAVGIASVAIYWPTPGFKGRTFKLCVLNRWVYNFWVHSSPLLPQ